MQPRICTRCGHVRSMGHKKKLCNFCKNDSNQRRKQDRHTAEYKARRYAKEIIRRKLPTVKAAISAQAKAYRLRHPERVLIIHARKRARDKNIQFSISESHLKIPSRCPWLGIPICVGGPKDNAPSLDRKNPKKGYTPSNIEVISWRANELKRNATLSELARMGIVARKRKRA